AVAIIDKKTCLYYTKGVCKVCQKFCPADAIDFEQRDETVKLEVAAIIVATGFDLLDPSTLPQYGYGKFPNVLTSLEFERLMNAAGPTSGRIIRLSDKKEPKKLAFIQCVGSRNENIRPYCSQFCCTYATKEAIVTKEHNPGIDITIFYNDLRASGKGHQEFVRRAAEEFGIEYVKGLPSEVQLDLKTNRLKIRYADLLKGEVKTALADMIVLCPAVVPKRDNQELTKILGIGTTEYGFLEAKDPSAPVSTNINGIYACGACEGPKDISHSVAQASAAAVKASSRTSLVNAKITRNKVEEKPLGKELRIGIFVCNCGANIGAFLDVPEVVEFSKTLEDVTHAEEFLFSCSKDSIEKIKDAIKEHDLNRVIVASCTPRTHELLFRDTCEEAGLNPYLFEMVNIREHDSWVHPKKPVEATEKAADLIRMAVAKARLLQPLKRLETDVTPSALVIGGGLSGLVAAKAIADKGFKVHLVEQKDKLGGRRIDQYVIPFKNVDANILIDPIIEMVKNHKKMEVLLSTEIKEVKGAIGNFDITMFQQGKTKKLKVGVIIVATGTNELTPKDLYGYGKNKKVVTISELQQLTRQSHLTDKETIVFILCVGVREKEGRTYCSSICCSEALDCAIEVKERYPNSQIYVLFRDIQNQLEGEKYYRQAHGKGIHFIRYISEKPPEVSVHNETPIVRVEDIEGRIKLEIPADKVALAAPLVPRETNRNLASILKVPLNTQNFFLEAHPKLRPLDFATDGIYLCGTCHSPQTIEECVFQALGAASRALIPLMKTKVMGEAITAEVNPDLCISCGNCEVVCEYGAIRLEGSLAKVNPFLCKGCGTCAVECPAKAITMYHFDDYQLLSMIRAALEKPPREGDLRAVAFFCNWCAYAGSDMAGVSRFSYPSTARIIRVMCSGRVDEMHILQAFLLGADGVLVGGCHQGDCHYISGNLMAEKRVKKVKGWLEEVGLEPERLRLEWVSAGEGKRLAEVMKEFTAQLRKVGPSPLREVSKGDIE
ncbi:hydrogenase iron-sulfur subunit, partial [Candidatus Bathyarchaeota archaeon]|nr:hydrogenase iron-sulfur subunit [Candidatus Bathyarchaeota archaeon]